MKYGAGAAVALFGLLVGASTAAAAIPNPHNLGLCMNCHTETPRFGIDTRKTVSFKTSADDPGLCSPCHTPDQNFHPILVAAGSGPEGGLRSSYLPAGSSSAFDGKIVCISCHFIHAADGRYGLLRGFPGSPDPRYFTSWQEFCRECHGENLKKRSPHGQKGDSCGFCHPARPKADRQDEVMSRGRELCSLCHGMIAERHYEDANPFEKRRDCTGCHDPHGKSAENLSLLSGAFLAVAKESPIVRPHFRKAFCNACHANTDDYALRNDDVNELCNRCHASGKIPGNIHPLKKVPAEIKPPTDWPLADGALTCLTCHEQGHEDQMRRPKLLRGGPYGSSREVCWRCHNQKRFEVSDIHRDINAGRRCDFCHAGQPAPGKDTFKTIGFLVDPNLTCNNCHNEPHPGLATHYQTSREPTGGKIPPEMPLYKGERMMCATCHNPHVAETASHKLRGVVAGAEICPQCHLFE